MQAIIFAAESSRRMVLTSQSRSDFSAGTENTMWKELWLAKDFAISVVPRGRRRWSSPWVIWGLLLAGLSVSDKICDFILVFWWRPGHPAFFSQKERNSLPSSVTKMLASCKGELYMPVLHPSHRPPSRPASWFLQWCFPDISSCTKSRHILDKLYLFKTMLFLQTDADFPPLTN